MSEEKFVIEDGVLKEYSGEGEREVKVPDGVKEIAGGLFNSCSGLKEVYIPATVEKMGSDVFFASGNKDIVVYCEAPEKPPLWHKNWDVCDGLIFKKRLKTIWGFKAK